MPSSSASATSAHGSLVVGIPNVILLDVVPDDPGRNPAHVRAINFNAVQDVDRVPRQADAGEEINSDCGSGDITGGPACDPNRELVQHIRCISRGGTAMHKGSDMACTGSFRASDPSHYGHLRLETLESFVSRRVADSEVAAIVVVNMIGDRQQGERRNPPRLACFSPTSKLLG